MTRRVTSVLVALATAAMLIQPTTEPAHGALAATRLDWGSKPSMLTPRNNLALAAAPNGKLYVVGGIDGASIVGTVEEYDPATNVWTNCGGTPAATACRVMPTARTGLGLAAATNGKLYAVGGFGGSSAVEEYDPATNTWTPKTSLPIAFQFVDLAAAPNGKLYAINDFDTRQVLEYDPATNIWTNCGGTPTVTACQAVPTGRDFKALAAAPNGRLYAMGGFNFGFGVNPAVEEYDPAANAWAGAPAVQGLPVGLQFAASAVFQGRIYVFGGGAPAVKDTVYEYTPPANGIGLGSWRGPLATMPTARSGAAAVLASNNKIYVVGGGSTQAICAPLGTCTTVEEYTPPVNGVGNGSWKGVADGIKQLNVSRFQAGLALSTSNNKIYIAGGSTDNGTTRLETVEEYDPVANTVWRPVASMVQKRIGLGLAEAGDGKLYAVGGIDGGNPLTTVERFTVPPTTATTGSWEGVGSVVQLPVGRAFHGLVASNGNLFVVGGAGLAPGALNKNDVFELDPTATGGFGAWSVNTSLPNQPIRAPMPTARFAHTVAVVNQGLYAIGGTTTGSDYLTLVERAVVTRLPGASAGGPYTGKTGQALQLNGTGNDADGDSLTFAWDLGGLLLFNVAGQSPSPTISLKNGTFPVYVRALDSNGGYTVSQKTTLTVTCGPRPNVQVQTVKLAAGQVKTTLTSGQGAFTGNLSIGLPSANPPRNIVNARVDVQGGQQNLTTNTTVPISGTSVVLTITRVNPGAVMVPLSISDGCDAWNSFVGFGTGV